MKNHTLNSKDLISVINFVTEIKRVCDSSRIQKSIVLWHFGYFKNGPTLAVFNGQLNLSPNDLDWDEGTITPYAKILNLPPRRYTTHANTSRADEKIRSFKQGSLTAWDVSQKLWDLALWWREVGNDRMLQDSLTSVLVSVFAALRDIDGWIIDKLRLKTMPTNSSIYRITRRKSENHGERWSMHRGWAP